MPMRDLEVDAEYLWSQSAKFYDKHRKWISVEPKLNRFRATINDPAIASPVGWGDTPCVALKNFLQAVGDAGIGDPLANQ
jgi:hypothetical protein